MQLIVNNKSAFISQLICKFYPNYIKSYYLINEINKSIVRACSSCCRLLKPRPYSYACSHTKAHWPFIIKMLLLSLHFCRNIYLQFQIVLCMQQTACSSSNLIINGSRARVLLQFTWYFIMLKFLWKHGMLDDIKRNESYIRETLSCVSFYGTYELFPYTFCEAAIAFNIFSLISFVHFFFSMFSHHIGPYDEKCM